MKIKCPRCQKEIEYSITNPFRPFCSQRCRDVDLGLWVEGKYAIPGASVEQENNPPISSHIDNDDDKNEF